MDDILNTIAIYGLPLIFAITLHGAARAFVARYFGDNTAYLQGRMTLNPISHIDPIGTIVLPGILVLIGAPILFGWAKPVPVHFGNLRNPQRDMRYVAVAGPMSNLVMAFLWAVLLSLMVHLFDQGLESILVAMCTAGVLINVVFMLINLLPILPLDGGRILESFLPTRLALSYSRLEPYGMLILVALLITGALNFLFAPWLNTITRAIIQLTI